MSVFGLVLVAKSLGFFLGFIFYFSLGTDISLSLSRTIRFITLVSLGLRVADDLYLAYLLVLVVVSSQIFVS